MALGLKDISLVLPTAKSSLTPMPLADLCHERLLASLAKGRDELDWAGFGLEVSEDAGLRRDI
jgi:3-hydroxyisobutyrate dehydrogenase-like beta-hydroxyacid dehydrogenase